MKKVVLFAVSAALVLAFATVGMAVVGHDIGHVGHVDESAWDYCTICDFSGVDDAASTDINGYTLTITSYPDIQEYEEGFGSHLGDPGDADGVITKVYAVINIDLDHTDPIDQDIILDFRGTVVENSNYLWIYCENDDTFHAFNVVNGIVVIPQDFANSCFSDADAIATVVSSETSGGGGGGGCNAGAVSPLMGLLALPLVWLLK